MSCGSRAMACKSIRPAEPQDHAAILALARCVVEAGDAFPLEGRVSKEELASLWLPDGLRAVEAFVCEVDDVDGIAAVAVLRPTGPGRMSHIAETSFMVTPAARARGLAKLMCAHVIQEARRRSYTGMRLNTVVATNVAAVRVCTSCGFKIVCTLPRAFRHRQRGLVDAHVMFCSFEDALDDSSPKCVVAAAAAGVGAGLSYPTAAAGATYAVNEQVRIEPRFGGFTCQTAGSHAVFSTKPALPEGLQINASSGVISGSPVAPCPETTCRVTAVLEADVTLQVVEPAETSGVAVSINEDFATRVACITDVADLMPEPIRTRSYGDWMIWMVHRAWLNDPSLTELNFNNMHMPPAHSEERIAPKLMAALRSNTHLEVLSLSNSNVQKAQGVELAVALQTNVTLRAVNLECNQLDSSAVRELALAIKSNAVSRLEHLRFSHQRQGGQFFGRPTEEAVGQMMEKNETIVKLGFECADAHWRNLIDRALLRNNDYWRRKQQGSGSEEDLPAAEQKTLGHLTLGAVPSTSPDGVLALRSAYQMTFCAYVVQTGKLPTASQLQSCAKNSGVPLPYAKAAPLIKECRSAFLDAATGLAVVVLDAFGSETPGTLRSWTESNDHWHLELWSEDGRRCAFRSNSEPAFSVSEAWQEWLLQGTGIAPNPSVGGS